MCRFGQGIGLGGEWGGAVLLAVENAPPHRRALYGMFPQLGAPLGFLLSGAVFLALSRWLTDRQFFSFGWRLPFLASAVLVLLGLYVRFSINETPIFEAALKQAALKQATLEQADKVEMPVLAVFRRHSGKLVVGALLCLATFVLFYLMIVFTLSWATTALGYSRSRFLEIQLFGVIFFALTIPISALLAERGRRPVMLGVTALIGIFGFVLAPMFTAGVTGATAMLVLGMALMGLTYGPLGTVVAELFPTRVRYTGSSIAFSVAGILGASLAPYAATWLAKTHGLPFVGYYLTASAAITFAGLLLAGETRKNALSEIASTP